ncbi:ATP biosynthetic process [Mactra antiquata]
MNCLYKQVRLVTCFKKISKHHCRQIHVTSSVNFLMKYLDSCLNIFDNERLQEVGGERLCAEWVLKNGGRLRWAGSNVWLTNYNSIPNEETTKHLKVHDIDLAGTTVMFDGMPHLVQLSELASLSFDSCKYLDDVSIKCVSSIRSPIRHLQISNCEKITDEGLKSLVKLSTLKELHLMNLPRVVSKEQVYEELQKALSDCEIMYMDLDHFKKQ